MLLENGKYNPYLKLVFDIAKMFHTSVDDMFEIIVNYKIKLQEITEERGVH